MNSIHLLLQNSGFFDDNKPKQKPYIYIPVSSTCILECILVFFF